MKKMTGFIGIMMLLVTTSCVSAEKTVEQDESDSLEPFLVKDGQVSAQDVEASLKKGRKVLVIFDEFADGEGNTWSCPVKVRTVDNVCNDPDFQIIDPSVICRRTGDYNPNYDASVQKIKWVGTAPFAVTFSSLPAGVTPCQNGDWAGKAYKNELTCKIKKQADLNLGAGDAIFLKYDIKVDDLRCAPLDPYFIIRR
jgi:hypothetical protein